MKDIFLNKSDYIAKTTEWIDDENVMLYIKLTDNGFSRFNSVDIDMGEDISIAFPIENRPIYENNKNNMTHLKYDDCYIIAMGNNELVVKYFSYKVETVNIADFRKDKIKNFLDD